MILILEIVGEHAGVFGADSRKVFKACGGVIGRDPGSDWRLPDQYISGRHAIIHYADEKFVIEDSSTNGVFINSDPEPIGREKREIIYSGDILQFDRFDVYATLLTDDGLLWTEPV